MADAWGRLTGEPGIAMVTGGPGHANAAAGADDRARAGIADGAAVGPYRDDAARPRRLPGTAPGRDGRAGGEGVVDRDRQPRRSAPMSRRRSASPRRAGPGRCISACRPICSMRRLPTDAVVWPEPARFAAAPVALSDAGGRCDPRHHRRRRSGRCCSPVRAGQPVRPRSAGAHRGGDADPDCHHGKPARLQRRHARRLRRCDPPRRPDRPARQGARLHAEVRRGAGDRCRPAAGSSIDPEAALVDRAVAREAAIASRSAASPTRARPARR